MPASGSVQGAVKNIAGGLDMKRVITLLAAVCIFYGMAGEAEAVPQTINYQGMLKTSGGTPVNGAINMTFRLYSSATDTLNPALWIESQPTVTVTAGRYSVVLGSVTPINLPFDGQYYLGVAVGTDEEMMPRQPLTSSSYAFRAAMADGLSSSVTLTSAGVIVSTVATGTAPLQVSSITMVQNLNADMVDGKHASDLVSKVGDTMTGDLTLAGANINLPTTTATAGMIRQGGNRLIHTYGVSNFFAGQNAGNLTMTGYGANTASGTSALSSNTTGYYNTASGYSALASNTTGSNNTANGVSALGFNTTGNNNTASGASALAFNTTGYGNTASGTFALLANTTGFWNTATGLQSLYSNDSGYANTASGFSALFSNTIGNENTATGASTLSFNTTGSNNTATGNEALRYNTSGSGNTASGNQALIGNTTGYWNTASGIQALWSNTTGNLNTAIGSVALHSNTTGTSNSALGVQALLYNSIGYDNTASGYQALYFNTSGIENTANGSSALYSNTIGMENTATGTSALHFNTSGSYNTANGYGALYSNLTGINNTANGYEALYSNLNSSGNTAVGATALFSNTGAGSNTAIGISALYSQSFNGGGFWNSNNTAIGALALYANQPTATTNGINNTALGSQALYSNTTGLENTAAGYNALQSNTTGVFNTSIGVSSLAGNTSGINNTASGYQALQGNVNGGQNTAAGSLALQNNTIGQFNVAMGYAAGVTASTANANTTGSNNTFIGANSGPGTTTQLTNATALGANAIVNASNSLVLGGTGPYAVNVGIGTTTPDANLDVTNMVRVLGTSGIIWPSTGSGLELAYNSASNGGFIQAYDRSGGLWGMLDINASTVNIGGGAGNLHVSGTLSKGAGSFKIDHPLDPRNKYLYHSFVESPDMKNIYDGVVTTDDKGYATVILPDWFEALNRDFRYQLTIVDEAGGEDFARAKVVKGMADNKFTIRTSVPKATVSWQVTGIRKDAFAEAHRIPVEQNKSEAEQGACLHAEACAAQ